LGGFVDLDERGKQLRQDIEQLYSRLQSSNALGVGVLNANDISEFIAKYIPEGLSFDDAEQILRSAGLRVYNRPHIDVARQRYDRYREESYDVVATMLLPGRPWSRVELMINLRPKAPGDYSTIKAVGAAILVVYL
jgi:hypothetical protein